jgi:[protein-PII] uridylyltransferase
LAAYQAHATVLSDTQDVVRFIKPLYEQYQQTLDEQVTLTSDITELLSQRSLWLDEILLLLWQCTGLKDEAISLLALGGYGLTRVHPGSDADLLLLHKPPMTHNLQDKLAVFMGAIWDCGIKLGASVRTPEQCLIDATEDLHFYTNLLSMRILVGQTNNITRLRKKLDHIMDFPAFLDAKMSERQARYAHFNDTEYGLEPNIKESPGGLRDLDLIIWLSLKKYQDGNVDCLFQQGDIDSIEYNNLLEASRFLWQIRYLLHLHSQGKSERLYFEYQDKIADSLSINLANLNEKMNKLMQKYYQTVTELREITDILCQYYKEQQSIPTASRTILAPYCERIENIIHITDYDYLNSHPEQLMHLFLLLAEDSESANFSARSQRFIRTVAKTLPRESLYCVKGRSYFIELLKRYEGVFKALTLMHRLGILVLYLPQMATLSGQMQYDLFHLYTVDAHTLFVLRNCEWIFQQDGLLDYKLPFVAKDIVAHPEILFLAGLLHDIGKGQGGNHSAKGALIAKQFCEEHDLPVDVCESVAFLVLHHLLMSEVAQHQDIGDEEIILRFSTLIKTPTQLSLLYLLTIADIYATNPSLWNHWRSALLRDLYLNTKAMLDNLKIATPLLDLNAWHAMILSKDKELPFQVEIKPHRNEAGTDIFIFARENPYLLANILATLEKCFLTIVQARIGTTRQHFTLQSYVVLEQPGTPIKDPARLIEIKKALETLLTEAVNNDTMVLPIALRHIRRSLKFFSNQILVTIENKPHLQQTLLTLHAPDFPGLLARVAQTFVQCDVTLHSAMINTQGAKVEDTFYLTSKETGLPLQDAAQIQALKDALTAAISKGCK